MPKRPILEQFEYWKEREPNWSTYTCFAETIRGRMISGQELKHWFLILVDKSDYLRSEQKEILAHLSNLNKG